MTQEQARRADTLREVPDLREDANVQKPGSWWIHFCVVCAAEREGISQAEAATQITMNKSARNLERAKLLGDMTARPYEETYTMVEERTADGPAIMDTELGKVGDLVNAEGCVLTEEQVLDMLAELDKREKMETRMRAIKDAKAEVMTYDS